ncbi:putative membrane protein [Amaricoccus macauensis]|uniref:Putative membrane protein n=1 Tax=Amaricoccus macauensis TaxID=57001 RepID=A0A840SKV1_9RHOB|nr:DUF2189 domain-containing protein [Amaricoccus macauensis]MBB5221604.1 putative membrane protein [Amaricoccus macauensis]
MEAEILPKIVPPLPRPNLKALHLPRRIAFDWLRAGWKDLVTNPLPSLLYGFLVFLVSLLVVWGLFQADIDYFLPATLSGFMVIGPLIAAGLYEKSRRLETGERTRFWQMICVRLASGYQTLFLGLILLLLFLLWQRAAVLLFALHIGVRPFPGVHEILPMLFTTWFGWSLMISGIFVGGIFAAFAFSVSVFSVPMMLEEHTDALSAMGISMSLVWNNLAVLLAWAAIVVGLFVLSVLTGFLGLIVIFPLLGHATWHAYRAIRTTRGERVFFLGT